MMWISSFYSRKPQFLNQIEAPFFSCIANKINLGRELGPQPPAGTKLLMQEKNEFQKAEKNALVLKVRAFLSIILSSDLSYQMGKNFSVFLLFGSIAIGAPAYLFFKPILIGAVVGFNCFIFSSTALCTRDAIQKILMDPLNLF